MSANPYLKVSWNSDFSFLQNG